jgi:hypothetical protein
MKTILVCRDVRPAIGNARVSLVVASQDEQADIRSIDPTDPLNHAEIKARLQSHGITLGGSSQPAIRSGAPNSLRSPFQVVALDEHGTEHRLVADSVEEYSLSTGSTLYYLYVPELHGDYHWLVGRTLELDELPASAQHRPAMGA